MESAGERGRGRAASPGHQGGHERGDVPAEDDAVPGDDGGQGGQACCVMLRPTLQGASSASSDVVLEAYARFLRLGSGAFTPLPPLGPRASLLSAHVESSPGRAQLLPGGGSLDWAAALMTCGAVGGVSPGGDVGPPTSAAPLPPPPPSQPTVRDCALPDPSMQHGAMIASEAAPPLSFEAAWAVAAGGSASARQVGRAAPRPALHPAAARGPPGSGDEACSSSDESIGATSDGDVDCGNDGGRHGAADADDGGGGGGRDRVKAVDGVQAELQDVSYLLPPQLLMGAPCWLPHGSAGVVPHEVAWPVLGAAPGPPCTGGLVVGGSACASGMLLLSAWEPGCPGIRAGSAGSAATADAWRGSSWPGRVTDVAGSGAHQAQPAMQAVDGYHHAVLDPITSRLKLVPRSKRRRLDLEDATGAVACRGSESASLHAAAAGSSGRPATGVCAIRGRGDSTGGANGRCASSEDDEAWDEECDGCSSSDYHEGRRSRRSAPKRRGSSAAVAARLAKRGRQPAAKVCTGGAGAGGVAGAGAIGETRSRYRGVTRHRRSGRWEAHLWVKQLNRQCYLGGYSDEEAAAEAYDLAALKVKGLNTQTNFDKARYADTLQDASSMTYLEVLMSIRRQSQGFSRGSSSYRGVTAHPSGRWESRIGIRGSRHVYLGLFTDEKAAARAYDAAMVRLKGQQAATNFSLADYAVQLAEFQHVVRASAAGDAAAKLLTAQSGPTFDAFVKGGLGTTLADVAAAASPAAREAERELAVGEAEDAPAAAGRRRRETRQRAAAAAAAAAAACEAVAQLVQ